MAVESTTPNLGLQIPALGKTYKTEIDFTINRLDTKIKALDIATTHVTSGAAATLDVSNSGAGKGIKVDKLEITTNLDVATILDAGSIEILPTGAATGAGIKYEVLSSRLKMSTTQTSGFQLGQNTQFDVDVSVLGDLSVSKIIKSTTDIELKSDGVISFFPDFDLNPTNELKVSSGGAGAVVVSTSQQMTYKTTNFMNIEADIGIFLYPKFTADTTLKLGIQNNSGDLELFSTNSNNVILTSSGTFLLNSNGTTQIKSDDTISIFPDFDGNATQELQIEYNPVAVSVILKSVNSNLDLDAVSGGDVTLSVAGISLFVVGSSKILANAPIRLKTAADEAGFPSPATGWIFYNNTLNKIRVFTGSVWETVTSV